MARAGATSVRAELHYQGEAPPGDGLPAVVVLDPTQRHSLDVGRQSDCSVVLDSRAQALMISRRHATLTCDASTGQWKLTDMQSTNGVLYNGIKVTEANLSNNDIVTFGGAKSTMVGALPSVKAPKSIYVYKFVVHDDNVSSSQTTPFSGQKRDRSASEREEDRERKRQQREEQEAEERANREQQERERREREEREQQQREEQLVALRCEQQQQTVADATVAPAGAAVAPGAAAAIDEQTPTPGSVGQQATAGAADTASATEQPTPGSVGQEAASGTADTASAIEQPTP